MSDEIKEILDYLKNDKYAGYKEQYKAIRKDYAKILLDYITNLQEENKELNKMCEIYSKSLYNADLTKAEKRIEKAIEYIEGHIIEDSEYENYMQCEREEKKELLNILGGDKE